MPDDFEIIAVSLSIFPLVLDASIFFFFLPLFLFLCHADPWAIKKRSPEESSGLTSNIAREFDGKTILILRPLSEFKATFNGSQLHGLLPFADTIMRADEFAAAKSNPSKLKTFEFHQVFFNVLAIFPD